MLGAAETAVAMSRNASKSAVLCPRPSSQPKSTISRMSVWRATSMTSKAPFSTGTNSAACSTSSSQATTSNRWHDGSSGMKRVEYYHVIVLGAAAKCWCTYSSCSDVVATVAVMTFKSARYLLVACSTCGRSCRVPAVEKTILVEPTTFGPVDVTSTPAGFGHRTVRTFLLRAGSVTHCHIPNSGRCQLEPAPFTPTADVGARGRASEKTATRDLSTRPRVRSRRGGDR